MSRNRLQHAPPPSHLDAPLAMRATKTYFCGKLVEKSCRTLDLL